ncbi:hypothetical protein CC1G_03360 [Coprinopsis cinerea okayama7|uniref:Uncharacterized protein n=1 Tax=Coprinopsis cinerea (strain Okayama-7 / 130 / ATCC MYA-4618 / FGSC 9003) TaxID=240176 RepID=A8NQY7_COPC7|nr:hypothetical protein CC1G_03360 [Coprinopsis cinerea okayama7\|eukprot:XP_001835578.2 hypothetical protein CC1G_03360 [Coprinopsis cinerea okayama7\
MLFKSTRKTTSAPDRPARDRNVPDDLPCRFASVHVGREIEEAPINLKALPNEILHPIFKLRTYSLVHPELLSHVPIRLQTEAQARAFLHYLTSTNNSEQPPASRQRRYNPYDTPPEEEYMNIQHDILRLTTNLETLACTGHNFLFLCEWKKAIEEGWYSNLRELTLLDQNIYFPPQSWPFTKQITHLALLDPGIITTMGSLDEPFPSLQGLAFEFFSPNSRPATTCLPGEIPHRLETLYHAKCVWLSKICEKFTIMTVPEKYAHQCHHDMILSDGRTCVVRAGRPEYFKWWAERTRGCDGIFESP